MKKINFKLIGVLMLVLLGFGSCKKWIDTDINTTPNSPPDADMSTILSYAETNMAYNTIGGNDISRVTSIWMQYIAGVSRQSNAEQNYYWYNSDDNNLWNGDYATTMSDLRKIISKADAKLTATSSPADKKIGHIYKGIAEVLLANTLGVVTDVWGDIPYSDAFQGAANLQPKFDTQEQIYALINATLDDAIANLTSSDGVGTAERDLMFGGKAAPWTAAAWSFKARYALHLSKLQGATAYQNALAAIANGAISSNDGDLQFNFPGYPYSNPFFNFENERGDVTMHKTFIDMLNTRFDPREPVYADPYGPNGEWIGAGFDYGGDGSELAWPGSAVAYETSPVQFITNAETMFIKTECEFQTGVAESTVKDDLVASVRASMDKWGVTTDAYMAAYDSAIRVATVTGVALYHEIMVQKYIALYMQLETFNDWRRTENIIGLAVNDFSTAARHAIPRRYPYSVDEVTYNSKTPKIADIWVPVWWDVHTGK